MQAAASILVSGNTTLDVITICNVPYNPSGKRPVTQYKQTPGGQAANVAHLLANLGNNVSFVGAIGNDAAAQIVMEDFRCAGIEVLHSAFCSAPHHIGFVRVDQNDGERFIDMYKDPKLTCDSLELDEGWVKGFDCIYIDSHEPALAIRIGQLGQKLKIPVVADLEEVNENTSALLQYIDVLIAPGKIVTQLGQSADVEKAVQSTLEIGFASVVSTLGAGGCLGVSREENKIHSVSGIPVTVSDTTGAGDAFHGAFIHAMLNGYELVECLNIANTIAAQKCTFIGPRIPTEAVQSLAPVKAKTACAERKWYRDKTPTVES